MKKTVSTKATSDTFEVFVNTQKLEMLAILAIIASFVLPYACSLFPHSQHTVYNLQEFTSTC